MTAACWLVRSFQYLTLSPQFCPFLALYRKWSSQFDDEDDEAFCWSYVVFRLGVIEPFFLFLSLLTFNECLTPQEGYLIPVWWPTTRAPVNPAEGPGRILKKKQRNFRIVSIALFWTFLVFFFQSLIPALEALGVFQEADSESQESLFIDFSKPSPSWKEGESGVCVIPLFSSFVSGLVIARYIWLIWLLTLRMGQLALNQCLERRMRFFRALVTVLLISSLMFRSLGALFNPGHVFHEFCRLAEFLSVLIFVSAFSFLLVIKPVREGRIADKNANKPSNF